MYGVHVTYISSSLKSHSISRVANIHPSTHGIAMNIYNWHKKTHRFSLDAQSRNNGNEMEFLGKMN